ncbi:SNF2 family N-terminal domain-containing protein [Hypoxylon argillaceum]|nr:SNF2 family N-terminal domain-containing protein [Hypoxylon argillaceum]
MDNRLQGRRRIEVDSCEGNQLGAKRRRMGEYLIAGNTAFYPLDFTVPASTPTLESGSDASNGSIYSDDRELDEQCATTDSTFMDTKYTDSTFNDTVSTNSRVKDAALTDDMCTDAEMPAKRQMTVCYGSLCNVKAKIKKSIMASISTIGVWDQYQEFELFQLNGVYHLRGNKSQESIGVLDIASSRILDSLYELSEITHTVIIETLALKKLACTKTQSGKMDASINILGPESLFQSVGDAITKAKGYLQHPFFLPIGTRYVNPHWVYPHDVRADLRHLIRPVSANYEDTRLALGLADIFQSLGRSEGLGITLESPVELLDAKKSLLTPLKPHQEEGVKHILTRENSKQAASAALVLQGVIGHKAFKDRLIPLHGGIDADVMGLGKTLTILSAIFCTIQLARDFAKSSKEVRKPPTSRATLVITPSHQLIEVWRFEVEKHFTKGSLRVGIFHGSSRAKAESEIIDNDIVLTTYHTLVADQKSSGLLQRIEWFPHYIRNNTSKQFKATCSLMSARRWCLSGTPISNSLDDLRSLLAFLQFHPFSDASFFRKHIIEPLCTDSPDQFRNLRMLLHAICFRRTAELLSLPSHLTEEVAITLSSREDEMYKEILAQSQKEYENIANMKSSKKKHTVLFTVTMQLRRLCNHDAQSKPLCEYCYVDNADLGFASDTLTVCPECSRALGHELGAASTHGVQSPSLLPFTPCSPSAGLMGCSAKLNAVVDNIQRTPVSSKNLVFTSWRTTLDILQQLLIVRGIPALRIDGETSFTNRQLILNQFCQDHEQTVLLLSIATGAVGLTLTAADRVHIVEPQWNPLVEEQAIGRALRIGQTRSVTVFKYITKNTVEEVRFIKTLSEEQFQD